MRNKQTERLVGKSTSRINRKKNSNVGENKAGTGNNQLIQEKGKKAHIVKRQKWSQ